MCKKMFKMIASCVLVVQRPRRTKRYASAFSLPAALLVDHFEHLF